MKKQPASSGDPKVDKVMAVLSRRQEKILALPNVVGVGVGYKIKGGKDTGEVCISVSVTKKVSSETLSPDARLPERIEGISTDVVETGEYVAQTA